MEFAILSAEGGGEGSQGVGFRKIQGTIAMTSEFTYIQLPVCLLGPYMHGHTRVQLSPFPAKERGRERKGSL